MDEFEENGEAVLLMSLAADVFHMPYCEVVKLPAMELERWRIWAEYQDRRSKQREASRG